MTKKPLTRNERFAEERKDLTDRDLVIEMLYAQKLQIEKLERIRTNTSVMVWFFIVLPIIFLIFAFFGALL